jgi:hypothetical protein
MENFFTIVGAVMSIYSALGVTKSWFKRGIIETHKIIWK